MAFVRLLAVSLLTTRVVATLGDTQTCAGEECVSEESSLLALRATDASKSRRSKATSNCTNRYGVELSCGADGKCCGDVCAAKGDECCQNANGNDFPCSGSCCGNACAAHGSKCCTGDNGYKYPVSEGTACAGDYDDEHPPFWSAWGYGSCRNRRGEEFPCGPDGKCCGDICAAKGDKCCKNSNDNDFACSGSCCGNACAAEGSKCCSLANGYEYPATDGTACSGDYVTCMNRDHTEFYCGAHSTCCGDICVGEGSACCENSMGNNFACGAGSSCCGNACAGPNSKCCEPAGRPMSEWYPVSIGTMCRA